MSLTEVIDKFLNADYKLDWFVASGAFWAVVELGLNLLYSRRKDASNEKTQDLIIFLPFPFCKLERVEVSKLSNKRDSYVVLVQRSSV